jgi:nitrite reductase/ring-hydroxylating ferredoxin subunit
MSAPTAHVVGPITDLTPGEGRTYVVDGRQIAVFLLSDGSVRAMDAVCPHSGGPLADGQADASVVICPLHAYAFRLGDGSCTSDGVGKVRTYPAQVVEDSIAIRVS